MTEPSTRASWLRRGALAALGLGAFAIFFFVGRGAEDGSSGQALKADRNGGLHAATRLDRVAGVPDLIVPPARTGADLALTDAPEDNSASASAAEAAAAEAAAPAPAPAPASAPAPTPAPAPAPAPPPEEPPPDESTTFFDD